MWSEALVPVRGGQELAVANLAAGLLARGHQVSAIASGPQGVVDLGGMDVHLLPMREAIEAGDALQVMRLFGEVARLKKTLQPDLVHLHFLGPSPFFHMKSQAAWPAPMVLTVHGELHHCEAGPGTLLGGLLHAAGTVAAVSEAMADEVRLREPAISDKLEVIYNGQPALTARGRRMRPGPYLFCSGRHAPEKGLDLAIAAFPRLAPAYPDLALVIAGQGALTDALKAQATAAGLADRVIFTGWVPDEDLHDWIAGSAAVLVPSRWREGFGLVASEAAMLGRPVIASRSGGLEEVVIDGQTGLLVPQEDAQALATAIQRLLADSDAGERMGQEAARQARARFGFSAYVDQYEALYQRLTVRSPAVVEG